MMKDEPQQNILHQIFFRFNILNNNKILVGANDYKLNDLNKYFLNTYYNNSLSSAKDQNIFNFRGIYFNMDKSQFINALKNSLISSGKKIIR